jgi:hypothetical protein
MQPVKAAQPGSSIGDGSGRNIGIGLGSDPARFRHNYERD